MELKEITMHFWDLYFHGHTREDASELLSMMDPQVCLIGTGAHEHYANRQVFVEDLMSALAEHDELSFSFRKFTCDVTPAAEDTAVVWGQMNITGAAKGSPSSIDMDTRYSMVYVRREGQWYIKHIHHSVPFLEQNTGEYYPRGLYKQLEEVRTLADAMTELARKDSLTGLYNLRTLGELYDQGVGEDSWLVLGDLDNFKMVNDICGHMKGNEVLKQVANVLRSNVRSNDAVARIGGDEFVLLCHRIQEKDMERLLTRILENISSFPFHMAVQVGISMGAVPISPGEAMADVMRRADSKMYEAKHAGKNCFRLEKK